MSETTELVVTPPAETALQVYSAPNGLDPYIKLVKDHFKDVKFDMSNKKGRDACASAAYKVGKLKVAIEDMGKDVSAGLKELPKKVDAERKRANEILATFQAEVRKPLTDWEAEEAARITKHQEAVTKLEKFDVDDKSAAEIGAMMQDLDATEITAEFEEFETDAHRAKAHGLATLKAAHDKQAKYEAEQDELERLRKEAAEREQRDHEERIAREAAEAAQRAAEAKAQAERDAAAKREAEAKAAQAKAEQDKIDAENALKAAETKAEQDRLAAIEAREKAERDAENERLASEQRAKQAAENARLAEIQRQKDEQAQADVEAKAREANVKHKKAVNNAALDALVAGGIAPDCAKAAITLIAKGYIPAVRITY